MERPFVIVDDNDAHRLLIGRALKRANLQFPVVEERTLGGAARLLDELASKSIRPALAIFDLNLGDGRSLTLARKLNQAGAIEVPLIILSTSALEADVRESYAAGAHCYLTKSDDPAAFIKDLGSAVRFFVEAFNAR